MRPRRVETSVYSLLEAHPWPGNVRELESLAERLVVFGTDPVTCEQLPPALHDRISTAVGAAVDDPFAGPILPFRRFKEIAEERYIRRVLAHTDWNVAAAARLLDLQRTHLHQKMANLSIIRPGGEDDDEQATDE
jgi:DNA-binding NtrC family response regulator